MSFVVTRGSHGAGGPSPPRLVQEGEGCGQAVRLEICFSLVLSGTLENEV